jgi:hypothetical protein
MLPDPLRGPGDVVPAQGGVTWVVASTERATAEQLAAQYRRDGYRASVLTGLVRGQTVHRVAVGQFESIEEARRLHAGLPQYTPQDAWALRLN